MIEWVGLVVTLLTVGGTLTPPVPIPAVSPLKMCGKRDCHGRLRQKCEYRSFLPISYYHFVGLVHQRVLNLLSPYSSV